MIDHTTKKDVMNFNVNMTGKEYIKFKEYKDKKNKKSNKQLKDFFYNARYFFYAFGVYAMGTWLINTMFPTKTILKSFGMFTLFGLAFPYMLLYILIAMIGIAWIGHGFGFIIIKR